MTYAECLITLIFVSMKVVESGISKWEFWKGAWGKIICREWICLDCSAGNCHGHSGRYGFRLCYHYSKWSSVFVSLYRTHLNFTGRDATCLVTTLKMKVISQPNYTMPCNVTPSDTMCINFGSVMLFLRFNKYLSEIFCIYKDIDGILKAFLHLYAAHVRWRAMCVWSLHPLVCMAD